MSNGVADRMHRALKSATATLTLICAAPAASAATLHYGAYFAGAQVGQGEVEIHVEGGRYAISGEAWATGLIRTATHWRSDFSASGRFDAGDVVPETYQFSTTRRGDRSRTTRVVDGRVETFRDGRRRRSREAPDGLDVLTALFFAGGCETLDELHSGTSRYQLSLRDRHASDARDGSGYVERCEFEVVDNDGDGYRIDIHMGEHNGHRVPLRIDVGGFISGSVRLLEKTAGASTQGRVTETAVR
jgi:hypothetical protein